MPPIKHACQNTNTSLIHMIRKVSHFSLPMICSSLMDILPILASMWILSRLGKDYVAAAGLALPTFITIMGTFLAGFYAIGIKVGHSYGEDNNSQKIRSWVINGLVLALIFAILLMFILFYAPTLLLSFGQDSRLVALTKPFFFFAALNMIPFLINAAFNQYFSGIGHPRIAFLVSVIILPVTVILSYGLVLGHWGLPKLAMGGVTCAYLIADTLSLLMSLAFVIFAKWSKPFNIFSKPLGIEYKHCRELIKLGWPISVQIGSQLAASTVVVYLLGLFSLSALAAAQITQQYTLIYEMILGGLAAAVSILVSHAYGEKNLIKIKQTTLAGIIIMAIITLIFAASFFLFPTTLVNLYLESTHPTHSQLVQLTIYFMMIAAAYITFDGTRRILTNALRGIHDTKIPMYISIIGLWCIGLPLAAIAGFRLHGGPVALRAFFVFGLIAATLITMVRYKHKIKDLNLTIQQT